ncbi:MAG: 2-oxo acid dehydrogenase subunit E2 [Wenzhouxiangellaceae bacterium]|nr:MAG: 2-oxo acid dehydrogenase subunit E2 [Wenzhouxiangellaceae bacterium]
MKVFNLPDLGEGLPDAEIVEWLVKEGDQVELDQPMVSMETAKAVVEVPSPYTGRIIKFHGQAGDVIQTGAPLAEFDTGEAEPAAAPEPDQDREAEPAALGLEQDYTAAAAAPADQGPDKATPAWQTESRDQAAEQAESDTSQASDEHQAVHAPEPEPEPEPEPAPAVEREDSGTVVGNVQSSNEVLSERTSSIGGVKVTPAVRAMARKLKVDLSQVKASGPDGVVTVRDVREAADRGTAALTPAAPPASPPAKRPEPMVDTVARAQPAAEPRPAASAPSGEWEAIRGPRRTMVRVMSESHRSVVPTSLMDDADIHAWRPGEDITARLLRSLWVGAKAEPGLNAWFDGEKNMRMIHKNMHVGMAVDTPEGLFVAALRNVNQADRQQLRAEINRLRENTANRSIPPEDLKDYTIVLSNFGKFAGRYATPVVTPPCVAIVAAGALRHEVVPVLGGIEVHRVIPISLTFDHRACTGGEAARFLKAMLDDLAKAE